MILKMKLVKFLKKAICIRFIKNKWNKILFVMRMLILKGSMKNSKLKMIPFKISLQKKPK